MRFLCVYVCMCDFFSQIFFLHQYCEAELQHCASTKKQLNSFSVFQRFSVGSGPIIHNCKLQTALLFTGDGGMWGLTGWLDYVLDTPTVNQLIKPNPCKPSIWGRIDLGFTTPSNNLNLMFCQRAADHK